VSPNTSSTARIPTPPMSGRKSRGQRILLVSGIFAYVSCFHWMYLHYLYSEVAGFGFEYYPPRTKYVVLAWILSLAPSLWMPIALTRPSQLVYWILYITVVIPSMIVPFYASIGPPAETAIVVLTLFAGFVIVGAGYVLPLFQVRSFHLPRRLFWKAFGLIVVVLAVSAAVVFRHSLTLVSFLDVYDLRFAANDVAEAGTFNGMANYALMLMSGGFDPFLMGWGLYYGKPVLFFAGAAGQLLVYSAWGTKGSILSIVFFLGFYCLFKIGRSPFALKLTGTSVALLGGLCLSYVLAGGAPGPIHSILLFLLLVRTLSVHGLLTAQYYDFFQHNPLTYYSHVSGVRWLVHYPYANPIGLEVGYSVSGDPMYDATANLWDYDGFAALGLPGVLLISVLCALVFWMLDSLTRKHDPRLVALVISFAAYNIANISLFTSLLSGGLALIILWLYLLAPEKSSHFSNLLAGSHKPVSAAG
jgi:hypothetical protein